MPEPKPKSLIDPLVQTLWGRGLGTLQEIRGSAIAHLRALLAATEVLRRILVRTPSRAIAQQAERVRDWIENGRQLDRIVVEMEKLSLRMTERLLRQLKPV